MRAALGWLAGLLLVAAGCVLAVAAAQVALGLLAWALLVLVAGVWA